MNNQIVVDPFIIINAREIRRRKGYNHLSKSYMYLTTSRDTPNANATAYNNTGRAMRRNLYKYMIGLSILISKVSLRNFLLMNRVGLRNFLSKKIAILFNILFHLQEFIEKKESFSLP